MTRAGKGWCPFARQVEGVNDFTPGYSDRVGFCDHTAGGFFGTLVDPGFWTRQGVSVHFAVSRKGEIAQLVNIFDSPYAQGALGPVVKWPPYAQMGYANPNLYLISTEHEDAETVDGRTVFVPGSQWTPEQYAADLMVKRWCVEECARYGMDALRFGIDSLAGHHMFDGVNRAECPGRYWREEYQARLYRDLSGGGDVMQRYNAVASGFQNAAYSGHQLLNVLKDFGLTAVPAMVRIEVKLTQPAYVGIGDGDGGAYAGSLRAGDLHAYVDVAPDANGNITLDCADKGQASFEYVGIVGLWT